MADLGPMTDRKIYRIARYTVIKPSWAGRLKRKLFEILPTTEGRLSPRNGQMRRVSEIAPLRVNEFTEYVGSLLARREVEIYPLSRRLGVDPAELLRMINGRAMPTQAVIVGLGRELQTDVRRLEILAEELPAVKQPRSQGVDEDQPSYFREGNCQNI